MADEPVVEVWGSVAEYLAAHPEMELIVTETPDGKRSAILQRRAPAEPADG